MDSKLVNAELRLQIRPVLKAAGFARFTDRNAWRYAEGRIDVVNFQSFNSYLAEGIGSTTYSFSVNLACVFTHIPRRVPWKLRGGQPAPPEWEGHVRRQLRKRIEQPELPRADVWYVDQRGVYLMPAIGDAKHVLISEGLPWFDRFASLEELLRTLREDDESMAGTWGFGRNPSPMRAYLIGYTALHFGQRELAREQLSSLIAQGSTLATEQVRQDLARLARSGTAT